MLPKKTSIIILTFVMILINVYVINHFPLDYTKPIRSIATLSFLFLFAFFGGFKQTKLTIAFVLFFLSDLCIIHYDVLFYNNLTSVVRSFGYLFIGLHLLPKFKLEIENRKTLIIYLIIIVCSAFMFFELIQIMTMTYKGTLHEYLYFFYAVTVMVLLILVGNYNFRYSSIQSTACMYFLFSFVVSDLFAAIAFYMGIYSFYYPTRIFYILGLATLTGYAVLPFPKEELYADET